MEKKLVVFILLAVAASASMIPSLGTAIDSIGEALPGDFAEADDAQEKAITSADSIPASSSETETPASSSPSSIGSTATEVTESTTDGSSTGNDEGGITGGDIAGIVVGLIFLISLAVGGLYFMKTESLGCFSQK